jgi:hypothetical protein
MYQHQTAENILFSCFLAYFELAMEERWALNSMTSFTQSKRESPQVLKWNDFALSSEW